MEPVYNFTWRGEDAFADHGVCTMAIGSTVIAERRDKTFSVAGRSGLVHHQDGAVEEVERSLKLYLPYEQGRTVSEMAAIRKWLKGYGQLTLSTIPDRYMLAYLTDMIDFTPVMEGFRDLEGSVIFRCQPFLYYTDVQDVTLTQADILANPGTAASEPKIVVKAAGDVDLMIGTQTILLTDLNGEIILDSQIQEAYTVDDSGAMSNANSRMAGDFPLLTPGNVAVSWSLGEESTLASVTISPRWRDEN